MKYAVILFTLYFKDHERQEKISFKLKEENGDEKQVGEFINGYRTVIKYLNMNDFQYLFIEKVFIETINIGDEIIRKEMLDISKLDI